MLSDLTIVCDFAEAVPRKILDIMNVQGLTRENVASHLQVSFLFFLFPRFSASDLYNYKVMVIFQRLLVGEGITITK